MARVRLCRTGNETGAAALGQRLRKGGLQEIRLDLLEAPEDLPACLRAAPPGEYIVAAGPGRSDPLILPLLERALDAGAAWIDMDAALASTEAGATFLRRHGQGVIVSLHDEYGDAAHAGDLARRLNALPAAGGKLALGVQDVSQAVKLADTGLNHPEKVVIATGTAGRLTRLVPHAFGSCRSYAADDADSITAAGQLTMDEAELCRIDRGDELNTMALAGGCGVQDSPGCEVYNRLFTQRNLPWRYIAFVAAEPAVFNLAPRLGITRLSVTTPLKFDAAKICAGLDDWARASGAVNSLRWDETDGWRGRNTDAQALADICGELSLGPQSACLIIGSGATASGAAAVVRNIGCPLRVATRHPEALKGKPGFEGAQALDPARDTDGPWDCIINCSPVGTDGASLPVAPPVIGRAGAVIDLVLPGGDDATPLVRVARAAGVPVIDGLTFWRRQGALQMSWFLDARVSPEALSDAGDTVHTTRRTPGMSIPLIPETIALVGMRGSGKSTVAPLLAEALGWQVVDSDAEVEQRLQCGIPELFARGDEALFRATEAAVIADALKIPRCVIATGGGCVHDETTRYLLGECFTVWLDATVLKLVERCRETDRPPLTHLDIEDELRFLMPRRAPLYRQCARLMVSSESFTPREVVDVVQHVWGLFYRNNLR